MIARKQICPVCRLIDMSPLPRRATRRGRGGSPLNLTRASNVAKTESSLTLSRRQAGPKPRRGARHPVAAKRRRRPARLVRAGAPSRKRNDDIAARLFAQARWIKPALPAVRLRLLQLRCGSRLLSSQNLATDPAHSRSAHLAEVITQFTNVHPRCIIPLDALHVFTLYRSMLPWQ